MRFEVPSVFVIRMQSSHEDSFQLLDKWRRNLLSHGSLQEYPFTRVLAAPKKPLSTLGAVEQHRAHSDLALPEKLNKIE